MKPGSSPARRRRFANLIVAFASIVIVVPIFCEIFLRAGIAMGVKTLRNPELYADYYSDDDYWKLLRLWSPTPVRSAAEPIEHPTLGWAPRTSTENPLGVVAAEPYEPNRGPGTVLFYGDSFTAGVSLVPIDKRVPQRLEEMLGDRTVYNYGVGGYGVDQIYLRMKETIDQFEKPYVVFGLLTQDLDRSVLKFFSNRPKPWLEQDGEGKLELKGTPVEADPMKWLADNPPGVLSYTTALTTRSIHKMRAMPYAEKERTYRRQEKIDLNGAILKDAIRICREHEIPIVFVLYYTRIELRYTGWREQFLRNLFKELDAPFIDVKEVLLRDANGDAEEASASNYLEENGHLNERGSFLVAEAISNFMTGRPSGIEFTQSTELVQNGPFEVTADCALPEWRMTDSAFVRLPCAEGSAGQIELVAGSKTGHSVTQKVSVESNAQLSAFLATLEGKSADPDALALIINGVTTDGKQHRFVAEHPGDGTWRTLEVRGELPANLDAIYVTMALRPSAKQNALVRKPSLHAKRDDSIQ